MQPKLGRLLELTAVSAGGDIIQGKRAKDKVTEVTGDVSVIRKTVARKFHHRRYNIPIDETNGRSEGSEEEGEEGREERTAERMVIITTVEKGW
ncbi:hypothetical protein TWF694_002581 [Orbilia ellipsospora]|uniref:Uncharacterized protein n=1 Tax=Orbilia ellipsospora TaxID=2528407 RepID=A0AAV9X2M6_9PEZI